MNQITQNNPAYKTFGETPFFGHRSFHRMNYDMVTMNGRTPIFVICKLLQKAGIDHFSQNAVDFADLLRSGKTWFLSKVELDIKAKLPRVDDMVEIVTWHRGIEGTKAFREYRVLVKDKVIMNVQTQWAHFDFFKKKVVKFDSNDYPNFLPYYHTSFEECISLWGECVPANGYSNHQWLNLRFSDFDVNKHLNFSTTFNLIEDFCFRNKFRIQNLKINYKSEITPNFQSVKLSWVKNGNIIYISVTQESRLFTLAEVLVDDF